MVRFLKHQGNWLYLICILFPLSSMCRIAPCLGTNTVGVHTWSASYSLCSQVTVFFWSTNNISETSVLQSSYLDFWGACFSPMDDRLILSRFRCESSEFCSSGRCDSTHFVLPIVCQGCWQPANFNVLDVSKYTFCYCNYSLTWKRMHLVPCVTGELFWQQCFSWTLSLGMNL